MNVAIVQTYTSTPHDGDVMRIQIHVQHFTVFVCGTKKTLIMNTRQFVQIIGFVTYNLISSVFDIENKCVCMVY